MITLQVKTKEGHIQSLQVQELISIDGRPYQLIPNIEERVQELERVVHDIVTYLNSPQPPPEGTQDATVRDRS